MNDLIKRDDALHAIVDRIQSLYTGGIVGPAPLEEAGLREAFEIVKELPTVDDIDAYSEKLWKLAYERGKREAMQWIKCSDRLPQEAGEYLIAVEMKDNTYEADMDIFNGKKWQYTKRRDVIAWMPLPQYQGSE